MKRKTGKELYSWTQQRMACLRDALKSGKMGYAQFLHEKRKVDDAWNDWRRDRDREREMKKPSLKVYTQHYPKVFYASPLPPEDKEE